MKTFLYLLWLAVVLAAIVMFEYNEREVAGLGVFMLGMVTFGFPILFLPSFVAAHRRVAMRLPFFLGNVFFGWTGIGWAVLLILAFSLETDAEANRVRYRDE